MNIKELIIGLTVSMLLGIGVAVTAHVIRGLKTSCITGSQRDGVSNPASAVFI